MPLRTITDSAVITELLGPLLRADPVRHTTFATITRVLASGQADGWCAYDGEASVAARSQPTTPLAVAGDWPQLGPLADTVASLETLSGLGGSAAPVEALAAQLAQVARVLDGVPGSGSTRPALRWRWPPAGCLCSASPGSGRSTHRPACAGAASGRP